MPIVILTDEERIGTTLNGKYRIDSIVGRGGMGTVFAATHTWTGRPVAVKLLNPDYAVRPSMARRFLHEARVAAALRHPHVVEVLDMGKDEHDAVYLVLELLHGETLCRVLRRTRTLDLATTLDIAMPIMDALASAHDVGIIHRDLKPANIFLARDRDGGVLPKLLDFGIAKSVAPEQGPITKAGAVIGTPEYMSPEQARGRTDVGRASDMWSMGVVLYECLCGELPFGGETSTAMVVTMLTTRATSMRRKAPSLPVAVADAIDRALDPEPAARHATMHAFRDALAPVAGELGLACVMPRRGSSMSSGERPLSGDVPLRAVVVSRSDADDELEPRSEHTEDYDAHEARTVRDAIEDVSSAPSGDALPPVPGASSADAPAPAPAPAAAPAPTRALVPARAPEAVAAPASAPPPLRRRRWTAIALAAAATVAVVAGVSALVASGAAPATSAPATARRELARSSSSTAAPASDAPPPAAAAPPVAAIDEAASAPRAPELARRRGARRARATSQGRLEHAAAAAAAAAPPPAATATHPTAPPAEHRLPPLSPLDDDERPPRARSTPPLSREF